MKVVKVLKSRRVMAERNKARRLRALIQQTLHLISANKEQEPTSIMDPLLPTCILFACSALLGRGLCKLMKPMGRQKEGRGAVAG